MSEQPRPAQAPPAFDDDVAEAPMLPESADPIAPDPMLRSLNAGESTEPESLSDLLKGIVGVTSPPLATSAAAQVRPRRSSNTAPTDVVARTTRTRVTYVRTDDPSTLETQWILDRVAILVKTLPTLTPGGVAYMRLEQQHTRLTRQLAARDVTRR